MATQQEKDEAWEEFYEQNAYCWFVDDVDSFMDGTCKTCGMRRPQRTIDEHEGNCQLCAIGEGRIIISGNRYSTTEVEVWRSLRVQKLNTKEKR